MVSRVRGTRDLLDIRLIQFALKTITKQLHSYHFQEIMTPLLEPVMLFKRSLGIETDVVSKEMFIVSSSAASLQDGPEDEICLRPEATASVVRAFIENGIQTVPWKVFLSGSMFRYERPQKGRYREFFQTNLEIIGARSIFYDVQVISMLDDLFREKCLLQEFALHLNFLGCPDDRIYFKKQLHVFLEHHKTSLCATCLVRKEKNILRVFDCKNSDCQALYENAPTLSEHLCQICQSEWKHVQEGLEELSVPFVHMPHLVRGLDYYNKTVFEFVSPLLGAQSAFCGGGRYDQLVANLGAKEDQPSIGAGIGIDRLVLLLETVQDRLPLSYESAFCAVLPLSLEQQPLALLIADTLIKAGIETDLFLDGSIKNMMKKADKTGAKMVLFIGADEQKAGTVKVKNLQSGNETVIKQIELVKYVKELFH